MPDNISQMIELNISTKLLFQIENYLRVIILELIKEKKDGKKDFVLISLYLIALT